MVAYHFLPVRSFFPLFQRKKPYRSGYALLSQGVTQGQRSALRTDGCKPQGQERCPSQLQCNRAAIRIQRAATGQQQLAD